MNGHLMIRPTCEKDAAALARIYAYYVEKTAITFEYTAPDTTEMERRRQEISQRYPYLVAESDAWSVESSIYVDVNIRKHGIGRKLYEALEKALKSMGILNINACIAVPRDNQDPYVTNGSMNFHQRLGYTLVGRFHNSGYKFDRWYDVVWMEKMIGPHTVHPRFPAKNETLFAL